MSEPNVELFKHLPQNIHAFLVLFKNWVSVLIYLKHVKVILQKQVFPVISVNIGWKSVSILQRRRISCSVLLGTVVVKYALSSVEAVEKNIN